MASVLSYGFIRGEIYTIIEQCMLDTETFDAFSNPWDIFPVTQLHFITSDGYAHHTLDIFRKEQSGIMMYPIRKVTSAEVREAFALALEVFLQFEAPDYGPEGVETFKRDIVENEGFISQCEQGICPLYAAFDGETMIGMIGMRPDKTHINLVFTKKEYHRRGVATAIFRYLLEDLRKENPVLKELTLNASPYGKGFYLRLGFIPLSEEQERNGIRYTPMKYVIP